MCVINHVCAEFRVQSSEHRGFCVWVDKCAYVNVSVYLNPGMCVWREYVFLSDMGHCRSRAISDNH
jgi:hypothetical protein